MQYFYLPQLDNSSAQFTLDREESRHLVTVLRKKAGDSFTLTNGKGEVYTAELLEVHPKKAKAQIISREKKHPGMHHLHLAVAPTKSNDRFEWFLEKATEIGIDEITPLICEHSERRKFNLDRYSKVLISGMKQSLRAFLPQLNPPLTFEEFMKLQHPPLRFIAHCHPGEKMDLKRKVAADKDILILIGPEGDFSTQEVATATGNGFLPVSLGEARLRTETAALVACTTVAIINTG